MQELWKPWCCSGSWMPHCSVRDRRTKKTDWPPIAGSWGHSSISILLFMLFALLEVKRLLLCLITSQVRSVLTAQTESRRLLVSICQNTDSATGTRALFPAFAGTSDNLHKYIEDWTTSSCPWIIPKKDLFNKSSFSKSFCLEKFSASALIRSLLAQ